MSGGGPIARSESVPPASKHGGSPRLVPKGRDGIQEFLVFGLGSERMGLPLASVQEILKPGVLTPVPRAPHDVAGILSVRGRITTVIDLRRRLGFPDAAPTRHTRILLVDGGLEVLGVIVDAVFHVLRLSDNEIEASSVVAADMPEHVLGLGRPRRGRDAKAVASAARGPVARAGSEVSETNVVVLLDPVALLRR